MKEKFTYLLLLLFSLISTIGIFFFYSPIKNIPLLFLVIGAVIVLSTYFIFYKKYYHDLLKLPIKHGGALIFSSALLTILFLLSSRGLQNYLADNSFLIIFLTYFGSFLLITIWILFITMMLLKYNKIYNLSKGNSKDFALYFLIIFLIGIVYWMAYYPAAMSYDSMWSWNQAHTKDFNDWHPIMFTWMIMILTFIWDSPAIVTLFQIILLSLIFAYSFFQLQKLGVKKYLLVSICLLMAITPSFGNYTIVIWKDVLYSASLLIFTVHIFLIFHSKGSWLSSKANIFLFFLSSFGVVFLRHNGFPVFILTMVTLIFLYRKYILKTALPIFLGIVIFHQILTGPIFKYLDIEPSDPNEALAIPLQQIGNVIINDGELTTEQQEYFSDIFPINLWKENFYPHTVDYVKFHSDYHREVIIEDYPKFFKMWGQTVLQNPKLAIGAFFNQTSLVWQTHTPETGFSLTYFTEIMENDVGIYRKPLSTFLFDKLSNYLEFSKSNQFIQFVWRPASYAFIIFLFSIAFFKKNGWKSIVVLLPFLLNLLSVTAALPAQDFRYLFANVLICFVFPLMALINPISKEE